MVTINQINSGAAWAAAAQAAGVPEWKAAITGAPSIADRFAATVQAYLDAAEVEGGFADLVYANFGVYGEFAFVAVHLEDALVFMDPLNGNLFGPLEPGSSLEAPPLLIEHSDAYEDGMGVRYYHRFGCMTVAAPRWRPTPPSGTPATWPLTPAIPATPTAPCVPPGGTPTWTCAPRAQGGCACTRLVTPAPPAPGTAPMREVCWYSPAGCSPAGSCVPHQANCQTGRPPPPGAGCNESCWQEWFY